MGKNNILITGDVYSNAQIMEIFRVSDFQFKHEV